MTAGAGVLTAAASSTGFDVQVDRSTELYEGAHAGATNSRRKPGYPALFAPQ
jgi:hypothetical protein